ncbi:MAG: DUF1559 domain-containing protein [Planctomycetales bacterium]|nr:DUF1559 domain-containing protein [Planctomycetales bacterium]
MRYRKTLSRVAACLLAIVATTAPTTVRAQSGEKLSAKNIPGDAIVAAFLSPSEILTSPEWELMPIEVLRAAGTQHVGIDPIHVDEVKIVVGMPGPEGPQAGAVIHFSQDYLIENLNPMILREFEPGQVDGVTVYSSRRPPMIRVHQPDPRTIVVSSGGYLKKMLESSDGSTGQVATLAAKISRRKGITILAGMEQIRPLITGVLRQNAAGLPGPLQGLTEVAELTDALFVNVDYAPLSGSMTVSAIARDETSASKLEQSLNDAIDFGQMIGTSQMKQNIRGDGDAVNVAMFQYIDRIADHLTGLVRPQRKGTLVQVNLSGNIGTTGILVGLLLPAVQAAREAARRMTASNELKQIGLALHNYHSAYKKLPDAASRDEAGNPLLSWRVAILPFIEQQALYEEFHQDEPWDSPHNIKLLERMPSVYVDPSVPVQPGYTVFQLPVGTGLMFEDDGKRKFRDVLDGLSNTIMAIETSRGAAVPWTKPDDWHVDMQDPLAMTGDSHQNGFHVLMGDGAVIFIAKSIDLGLFRSLLTRAGGEVIEERINR